MTVTSEDEESTCSLIDLMFDDYAEKVGRSHLDQNGKGWNQGKKQEMEQDQVIEDNHNRENWIDNDLLSNLVEAYDSSIMLLHTCVMSVADIVLVAVIVGSFSRRAYLAVSGQTAVRCCNRRWLSEHTSWATAAQNLRVDSCVLFPADQCRIW